MRLSEAFDKAINTHWGRSRQYRTVASNTRSILAVTGDLPLKKIDERVLRKLVDGLRAEGNADATVNRKLATLQKVLRLAHEWGETVSNIDFARFRERVSNGRIRVLTRQEETNILNYFQIEGHMEMVKAVTILLDTGMRLSELLRLDYRDVDLDRGLVHVWENKGDLPRSLRLTKRVRKFLRPGHGKVLGLTENQVKYLWAKARKATHHHEDKEFILHALRHTCASRLVQAGVPLYTVSKWLGHSSIKQTERYAHLDPRQFEDVVSVLERDESVSPSHLTD